MRELKNFDFFILFEAARLENCYSCASAVDLVWRPNTCSTTIVISKKDHLDTLQNAGNKYLTVDRQTRALIILRGLSHKLCMLG